MHIGEGCTTQVQPAPFIPVTTSPNGGASSTSTVLPAAFAIEPTLLTVIVNWTPRCPATKSPECVLATARSGTATTTAASANTLFAVLASGCPVSVTRAVLTSGDGAVLAILAMTTISG